MLASVAALVLARGGDARAEFPPVRFAPSAVLELDARAYNSEAEGYNGIYLRRARAGLVASLGVFDLQLLGEWAKDAPSILDAFVRARVTEGLELTAGYARVPTLPSAYDELDMFLPIPERSMTSTALWPGRDLGVEAHWFPRWGPFEAWVRAGNGSGSPLTPAGSVPAGTARVDLVLGRAQRWASRRTLVGLRVGGAVSTSAATEQDRTGIAGATPLGFVFVRPPPVQGLRVVCTWHAILNAGPVQLAAEAGVARDDRSRDTDGNPLTPREPLSPAYTAGGALEAAWMVTGERRTPGVWPGAQARGLLGAWEVSVRAERLLASYGAADLTPGGAWGWAASLHVWEKRWVAIALTGFVQRYDRPAVEAPDVTTSWSLLARATVVVP